MFDFTALSETTLVGMVGVFVLGGSVAIAFYRSHRAFRAREDLYHSLCDRIKHGKEISPSEYGNLSPEDRAALQALQLTKQTMARSRESTTPPSTTSAVLSILAAAHRG